MRNILSLKDITAGFSNNWLEFLGNIYFNEMVTLNMKKTKTNPATFELSTLNLQGAHYHQRSTTNKIYKYFYQAVMNSISWKKESDHPLL